MQVHDACHSAGLDVVATVCNMVANNIKALKHLGVSEKQPFFRFYYKKMKLCLILPISVDIPVTFS